jgi:hypothetical protein
MDIQKIVTFQNIFKTCLLVLLVCAGGYRSFAQDISIGDFRIPETRYQRLLGSLSGGWGDNDYNISSASFGSVSSQSNPSKLSNLQTSLNYVFAKYNEDNSFAFSSNLDCYANHNSSTSNTDQTDYYYHESNSQSAYQVSFTANILYSSYIVPDQWHWYVGGNG